MSNPVQSSKINQPTLPESSATRKLAREEDVYNLDLKFKETSAEPIKHCSTRSCACNTGTCTRTCTCSCD